MAFSFFTSRSRELSLRLRVVARGFQFSGVAIWALGTAWLVALPFMPMAKTIRLYRWMFAPPLVYSILAGASFFLIGRALLRRQRWGAYLAGVTLGVPLIKQFIFRDDAILPISGIVIATFALSAIVTVWDELGTVRDAEFESDEDDEPAVIPKRNRGYGESRTLPTPAAERIEPQHSAALDAVPVTQNAN